MANEIEAKFPVIADILAPREGLRLAQRNASSSTAVLIWIKTAPSIYDHIN